jgi:hypothetical protein
MAMQLNEHYLSLPSSANNEQGRYLAFQREVRHFVQQNCPDDIREKVRAGEKLTRTVYSRWQHILHEHGWAAPGWPLEHGGTGWDLRQRMIFEEAIADFDCPPLYHHGLGHIGPVIMQFGTMVLTGGARAIRSLTRVLIWHPCKPAQNWMAIITLSMDRKSGLLTLMKRTLSICW